MKIMKKNWFPHKEIFTQKASKFLLFTNKLVNKLLFIQLVNEPTSMTYENLSS